MNTAIDWSKWISLAKTLLPLLLALFGKTGASAPSPEQAAQLKAMGLTDEQLTLNVDWAKLIAFVVQAVTAILAALNPTPPTPGPTPSQG